MADNNNLRQRRGKKSPGETVTAGRTPAPAASSSEADAADKPTPIEQLRGARLKLLVSRDRTADLHAAWKNQLFRFSLLAVAVSLYQLQKSISSCILEIKDSDGGGGGEGSEDTTTATATTGADAIKLILGDSFCELVGALIAILVAFFLAICVSSSASKNELDHWSYVLSSALVPVTLGFYFHSSKQMGCVGGGGEIELNPDDGDAGDQRHQFPGVVIYHTIVTLAFWFMKSGMRQCEEHVEMVEGSIRDFERMEKKLALKEKLKAQKTVVRSRKK